MTNLSADIAEWVQRYEGLAAEIFRQSVQATIEDMLTTRQRGGNMPAVTGFLRNSLMTSTSALPMMDRKAPEDASAIPDALPQVELAIRNIKMGETLYAGFTAVYARRMNYGFTGVDSLGRYYDQRGYLFVEQAAQKWNDHVARVTRRASAQAGFS